MPRQISVRAVDASEFFGCCVACGVQVTFAHPVAQGVEKVVADGRSALAQRTDLQDDAVADLDACACCSVVDSASVSYYVDGDEWSTAQDMHLFGEIKPSADFVLFAKDVAGTLRACIAEAKLGVTLPKSGQARYPTRKQLLDKLDYSLRRLDNRVPTNDEAFLIASKSTIDEQEHRVHRWNQEHAFPLIVRCMCLRDFLETVDVALVQGSSCLSKGGAN